MYDLMWDIGHGLLILGLGSGAVYCGFLAWYLNTEGGRYMWEKIGRSDRERRARNKVLRDWQDGKN